MKRNGIIEERRKSVNKETRQKVEFSFRIIDRIQYILEKQGLRQKDLAIRLNKSESEVSKWMRGTHNFTIDTLIAIENALGAPVIEVAKPQLASIER